MNSDLGLPIAYLIGYALLFYVLVLHKRATRRRIEQIEREASGKRPTLFGTGQRMIDPKRHWCELESWRPR